jgi:hypothetical protein
MFLFLYYLLLNFCTSNITIVLLLSNLLASLLEKYELGVSNAWNATKLFINADIPPINEFKARLPS